MGICVALGGGTAAARADAVSVKTLHFATRVGPDDDVPCDVVSDLYTPSSATKEHPAPAILTTNGFGGSKDDQAKAAMAFAARGYVVLSYSGLGFGGSGCKIELDDRDYDGKAASQLVTFLGGGSAATDGTKVDDVERDATAADGRHHDFDPRVGMVGGSYGGEIQFAVAGIDPRVDTIVPIITWNDLAYSLAPNDTSLARGVTYTTPGVFKREWTSLFFTVGQADGLQYASVDPTREDPPCPNFDDRACTAIAQMAATGAPDDTTQAFARHASVTSFLDAIRIPTMLMQGQADTLFNLQESVATYRALKAQGTPVKLVWQSWGHSDSTPAPGEFDESAPEGNYEGRTILAWFDHYLKDAPAAPSLDFTFFRDWVKYTGDATPAYARTPDYPAVKAPEDLYLTGTDGLTSDKAKVAAGAATFATQTGGAATSYTETSALDQSMPVTDAPGTFARFSTPPLAQDTDVAGIPSVDVRLSAPASAAAGGADDAGQLVLFFKLYDVAPDGTVVLAHRLIAPARIANTATGPVHVELPGIVHRFAKGHRMALTIAQGDAAYGGNNAAGPVQVLTDPAHPGVLHVPVLHDADVGPVVEATAPATAARVCTSRRTVSITIRRAYRGKVRSATIYVGGRKERTLRGRVILAAHQIISLAPARKGVLTVRIVMHLKSGKVRTDVRRYRPCTKKGR